MHFVKKFGRWLAGSLLKLFLLSLAIVMALMLVFGTPDQLKRSVKDSGAYSSFVDGALQNASTENRQGGRELPLDRPEIKAAAKTAFPPEFLQASAEQVIDGSYRWLDNKTPAPDFRLDLSAPKQNFTNALADYAVTRAKGLPACTFLQLSAVRDNGVDPFNVPCLPPGFNTASIRDQVVNEIGNNEDFLKNPVITADSFPKDSSGKTVFQNAEQLPQVFNWVKITPYILGLSALLSAALIIFLHDERRRGIHAIGVTFLGTGIFLFVGTILLNYLFANANKSGNGLVKLSGNDSLEQTLVSIIRSLNGAMNQKLYIFCVIYALIGGSIILYIHLTRPPAAETAGAESVGVNPINHEPEQAKEADNQSV